MQQDAPGYDPRPAAHPGLHVIALIELTKGAVAFSAAIALALVGPAPIRAFIATIGERLHFDTHHSALGRLIDRITPDAVHIAAAAICIYAVLRFVLFWGLWRVKAWASWLGAVAATVYLPFCSYGLWRYPGWPTLAVLLLNIVIVWVLVRDLLRRRAAAEH
jgi:uncharacterized membrane protein (DUF2068 family)